jgi:hypothetical protein
MDERGQARGFAKLRKAVLSPLGPIFTLGHPKDAPGLQHNL